METIHIRELLKGSSVYDDVEGIHIQDIRVMSHVSVVKYEYDKVQWIHIWVCEDGNVPISESHEPDVELSEDMPQFQVIASLLAYSH